MVILSALVCRGISKTEKGLFGHLVVVFSRHEKCARCRERGVGSDMTNSVIRIHGEGHASLGRHDEDGRFYAMHPDALSKGLH